MDQAEAQKKLEEIKTRVEKFQKQVLKDVKEITGVVLLPPKEEKKNDINVLVVVDDSKIDMEKKFSFREDAVKKVKEVAEKHKDIVPEVIILEDIWQNCYDAKYDLLQMIAMGAITYDTGMMAAIKISEIHKSMVLKKFEKYIVSYVLAGSLVQGKATPQSDIDVSIIIDDTDVKKMTRVELRDKLRGIILGMGQEAGIMTGIKNKLNIQVWILTDFWDGIKEANPVYFTFLRDAVPFFDRGLFMPWKLLLKMGRIKPSTESIQMHMGSGEQMLKRVHMKLNEIGMEDMFWATLNPSQAALMTYGLPPPTPKETPELLREIFVKKEKLLEDEYVKILEEIIKTRKDLEHSLEQNKEMKIAGKDIDRLLKNAEKYLKRINKLFEQIAKEKEEESVVETYETVVTAIRDALKLKNVGKVEDKSLEKFFKNFLVDEGEIPAKFTRTLKSVLKAKKDYDDGKLTKSEVDKARKDSAPLLRALVDFIQKHRGVEIEKTKIRVKHGEKFAEIILLGEKAYIIDDIDAEERIIYEAPIKKNGSLGPEKKATIAVFEKSLAETKIPERVFIKQPIFENLKKRYGDDAEVLISYM